ncbi:hypothetical protein ABZ260_51480, partial [Streptosporangium sp. NPDC006013]
EDETGVRQTDPHVHDPVHDPVQGPAPVNSIPADADVVVCHAGLAGRARAGAPDKVLISFQVFIGDPAVAKLVNTIKNGGTVDA